MGRENLEDYNAEFLAMLEVWEAAKKYLHHSAGNSEPLDIAMLLGWTQNDGGAVTPDSWTGRTQWQHQVLKFDHLTSRGRQCPTP